MQLSGWIYRCPVLHFFSIMSIIHWMLLHIQNNSSHINDLPRLVFTAEFLVISLQLNRAHPLACWRCKAFLIECLLYRAEGGVQGNRKWGCSFEAYSVSSYKLPHAGSPGEPWHDQPSGQPASLSASHLPDRKLDGSWKTGCITFYSFFISTADFIYLFLAGFSKCSTYSCFHKLLKDPGVFWVEGK